MAQSSSRAEIRPATRRARGTIAAAAIVAFLVVPWSGASIARAERLPIAPVYQQTPVWCWAAVGEMVFRYHGVSNINPAGNFQCGIIALLHPACNQWCGNCIVPAGSLATMNNMLTGYPAVASQVTGTSTRITTSVSQSPLPLAAVERELRAGRPIVAGISPSGYRVAGVSEHVALIVGVEGTDLIVNDPFPFRPSVFTGNPYHAAGGIEQRPGQYRIPYRQFVTRLQWRESIHRIGCTGQSCRSTPRNVGHRDRQRRPAYGRSCRTPVGTCGPFHNQPALPVGSACWCGTPAGRIDGEVVP